MLDDVDIVDVGIFTSSWTDLNIKCTKHTSDTRIAVSHKQRPDDPSALTFAN